MSLILLQAVVSLLFAMSLFHKMIFRSVTTFLILLAGFSYVVLDAFVYTDIGFNVISLMLIFIYYRAMKKSDSDKILG
jgi:hypothetical protein